MDETNLSNGAQQGTLGAANPPVLERPRPHVKPAHLKALERASLRELRSNERERYRAEDAQDRAERERLRKERNAAAEARSAEARAIDADRAVAEALRREAWVDAHAEEVDAKRTMRKVRRAELDSYRRMEESRRQELRAQRNAQAQARGEARRKLAADEAGEASARRDAWRDACQKTAAARRVTRAQMREVRKAHAQEFRERLATDQLERPERNVRREQRDEEVRRAALDRATATALRRDAARCDSPEDLERAREHERAMRAVENDVRSKARQERNAEADARFVERQQRAKEHVAARGEARDPLLAARQEEAVARRAKREADRAAAPAARERRRQLADELRTERNAQDEVRNEELRRLTMGRELTVIAAREDYLDARHTAKKTWRRVIDGGRDARKAEAAAAREAAARRRAERNAQEEEHFSQTQRIARERVAARAADRDAAYEAVHGAYHALRAEIADIAALPTAPVEASYAMPERPPRNTPRADRAVERALQGVALDELAELRREQYRAENAQDSAELDHLRKEAVARDEDRAAALWDMAVARELASAERRAPWVDAHAASGELRRSARAAKRAALEVWKPQEEHRRAEMRAERAADEQARFEANQRAATDKALAAAQRHQAWIDSCEASTEARRAMRATLAERRRARREALPLAREAAAHARSERLAAEEERRRTVERAVQESEVASAMRREARRTGTPEEYERARAREIELREVAFRVRAQAREERMAAAYERFASWRRSLSERLHERAVICEAWLAARFEKSVEYRKMREADRAVRAQERPVEREEARAARLERNERNERFAEESDRINRERELMLVDLQEDYLDALATEHAVWAAVRQADKPARAEALEAERDAQAHRRAERLADEEGLFAASQALAKERTFARSKDRDAALEAARKVYRAMKRESWPSGAQA